VLQPEVLLLEEPSELKELRQLQLELKELHLRLHHQKLQHFQ
jgi:hypothetical protein